MPMAPANRHAVPESAPRALRVVRPGVLLGAHGFQPQQCSTQAAFCNPPANFRQWGNRPKRCPMRAGQDTRRRIACTERVVLCLARP
jgi:hypothetical protein